MLRLWSTQMTIMMVMMMTTQIVHGMKLPRYADNPPLSNLLILTKYSVKMRARWSKAIIWMNLK
ncbi:Uncharacterised protein [Mycobacteroides abscessus subsp. abscessus]|nr:Uncharacterised protein [Mycobacteroides abscessus subsp. abscessus]